MARKTNPSSKIIAATFKLATKTPWREITMDDIAGAAKITPEELSKYFPSKLDILDEFNRKIDVKVAKEFGGEREDESIRDQLFDILMSRFDALQPNKPAIKSILRETVPFDPTASFCGIRSVICSMGAALTLTGLKSKSPLGCIQTKALVAIYLRSLKVWLEDDSPDMAKTMATLDDNLAKAENLAKMLPRLKAA